MTGEQQLALALKVGRVLADAGIAVQRADVVAGNIKSWENVPAEGIIGRWLQNGWRVVEVDTIEGEPAVTERRLTLVK